MHLNTLSGGRTACGAAIQQSVSNMVGTGSRVQQGMDGKAVLHTYVTVAAHFMPEYAGFIPLHVKWGVSVLMSQNLTVQSPDPLAKCLQVSTSAR